MSAFVRPLVLIRTLGLVVAFLAAGHSPLLAQTGYFGQNRVQYQTFQFRVLPTEHFDIYFYPEEEEAARMAARMAERWYARLSKLLNHELRGRQPLILYASSPHFWQTNTIMGAVGEGTGGVTEAFKRRIVLPFAGPLEATDHVLGHELVHAFQYDITGTNISTNTAGALGLPLWFIEGMAEYLSIGPEDPHTSMWMREAARREKLPTIDELNRGRYFPYRYGHSLWAFIGGRYGDQAVSDLLRASLGGGGYREGFAQVLGLQTDELSKQWHDALFEAYRPVAQTTQTPAESARALINRERGGGDINVSPELSPDGTKLMFFSERDLFSIDLFMADARTGEVLRKITDTATDPHYESLQFLSSAGAWDPTSTRFVFPGIARGQPILTIVNTGNGRREREIRLDTVDEVLNPSWSPDGNRIAFSGLVGGFNDLFVYDLQSSQLTRLTADAFSELHPAWSPDGREIAFGTDRFSSALDRLYVGNQRIGIIDVESRQIREVAGFEGAKNISPRWAPDGRSLFFLSNRQGITNVYRAPLDGGPITQITNLLTGVSGFTALSPAMSFGGGRLVFSAYEDDGYSIYAIDEEERLAGAALTDLPRHAAVLPPRTTPAGPVHAALQNETIGLPTVEAVQAEAEPYRPRLSLDYAGQPTVGVGIDPFGTYAAGGVSFLFSDMLGNHTVATSAQLTSRFDEFGGGLMYLNRARRWNWGASIDQTPYVARAFQAGQGNIGGQNVYIENEYRILQVDRSLAGVISYPFSRAQRVEVTGGLRQIGLTEDITQRLFSLSTGQMLSEERERLSTVPSINLAQVSGALVYDTTISGLTSPIRGSRYRLELSQVNGSQREGGGSLAYTGTLADYRTYYMPVRPFTFAFRGLYYGRHGSSAGDNRLPTLSLGYPGLVRGYDPGSFRAGECGVQEDGSCPVFDRLLGSQVGILNAEVRFPLWSIFGARDFYGPLPIEMAVFSDAGAAWGPIGNTGTVRREGAREWVRSVGAAMRVNLFGFAVGELNYVRPLDRPGRGWLWQFNLRPGF
ncbi:MAG: PD40 domain-containing protein [Acidobacteria bacterium]|nr:PD40 domain-containing protein [Acidobacteriota bacterium]MBA3887325.1 PD40 domain-containing protein [Acidobacteriota bacterium]